MKRTPLVEKWLAELRSGAWIQTRDRLIGGTHESPTYCCLGVLCKIAAPERMSLRGFDLGEDKDGRYCFEDGTLPQGLAREIAATSDEIEMLIDLNDEVKASFLEIADVIDEMVAKP